MKIKKILFCIATNGKKVNKTNYLIKSILSNKSDVEISINLCGCTENFKEKDCLKLINAKEDAEAGMLSKLRSIASKGEEADIFVFVDDDFIFPTDWISRLKNYTSKKKWDILGNRILLPNGGRFWDRCTRKPQHRMVDYSHDEKDEMLYQTGGFWVISSECFNSLKWDESIPINADRKGFPYNEDVDMSIRAYKSGYKISFDKNNVVWHNDLSYIQIGTGISRVMADPKFYPFCKKFLNTIKLIQKE